VNEALIQALGEIDRPGDVCVSGDLPIMMPGLVVDGLGKVSLPLGSSQARELIGCCQQAPYGKGTQTLVDTSVRRVWELDSEHIQLTNPKWPLLIDSIIEEVQEKLGLRSRKLTAQLYKLLVYEKGSFFLPHRDGEHADRMVATLVVVLPSEHKGGALIVTHDDREYEIAFPGAASGYELSYAAFYADCQHEVKQLEQGYRLCLTYNVTLTQSRRNKSRSKKKLGKRGLTAPSFGAVVDKISSMLAEWSDVSEQSKLAIPIDHRYTRDGLTLDKLKGIDRSKAEVLFEAAQRSNCLAHLALMTLWQHGTAESYWDDYDHYRNRGDRSWHAVEEDDEDGLESEYEMGEIFDTSLGLNHWSDQEGRNVAFGEMRLDETEIVTEVPMDEGKPSEENFEEYTGNEGMTLERWYHRAAVIIWPRKKHFSVLSEAGANAAIGGLQIMVEQLSQAPNAQRAAQREACLSFAGTIMDVWRADLERQSLYGVDRGNRKTFLDLLCKLDDLELFQHFLAHILPIDGEIQLDVLFVKFCRRHGWQNLSAGLLLTMAEANRDTLIRNAELLRLVCRQRDKNPERIDLCAQLCDCFVEALKTFDHQTSAPGSWIPQQLDRAMLLKTSADAMLAIDAESSLNRLVDHTWHKPNDYPLNDVHLVAIFALAPRLKKPSNSRAVFLRWLANCRQLLQKQTARLPEKPLNYRREDKLSCTCADCRELSQFLKNPGQRELRLRLNKQRRRHLHGVIDGDRSDLLHVTERSGSPYTLVCTKTTASYRRAVKIYERDLKSMVRITDIEKRVTAI